MLSAMHEALLIILLSGVGTFLLRWLPLRQLRRTSAARRVSPRLGRFLQGIGPAAMAALLVVALWPVTSAGASGAQRLAVVLALAVLYGFRRLTGGIAGPTLASAIIYGATIHWLN